MPSHEPAELRRIRKERGLSLEALARKAGVSTATVWRAEVGRHDTADETLASLANALGVKKGELLIHAPEADTASTGCGTNRPHGSEDSPVANGAVGAATGG